MLIETIYKYSFYLLAAINLVSFFAIFIDKRKAENGFSRISEKTFFILAFLFGGVGIYLGMFTFHHKTKKWYFILIIPLIIVLNIFIIKLFLDYLNGQAQPFVF